MLNQIKLKKTQLLLPYAYYILMLYGVMDLQLLNYIIYK